MSALVLLLLTTYLFLGGYGGASLCVYQIWYTFLFHMWLFLNDEILDKIIQRKRKDYADPQSRQNMERLSSGLQVREVKWRCS